MKRSAKLCNGTTKGAVLRPPNLPAILVVGPIPAFTFGLYVRWSAKARTSYPISPAKLAALLKDVFGQNEVCFITDDLLRGQENALNSGYTVVGAKPTAEQHVAHPRTVDDSAFPVTIQTADRQPWRP